MFARTAPDQLALRAGAQIISHSQNPPSTLNDCFFPSSDDIVSANKKNDVRPNDKCRFMNCRAHGNQAYVPTEVEHIANVVTHAMCIVPSLLGLLFLTQQASSRNQYVNALVFGFALVALYSVSTTFHSIFYMGRFRFLKEVLHRCDRAVIYIFIAASYTPWLSLREVVQGSWTSHFCWLVWIMAVLGIIYQQLYHEKYKWLEITFYLVTGLLPALAVLQVEEIFWMKELHFGGFAYIIGVIFFKSDGRIPCAHAIWHVFVGLGSLYHYFAVCKYLMGKNNEPKYQLL